MSVPLYPHDLPYSSPSKSAPDTPRESPAQDPQDRNVDTAFTFSTVLGILAVLSILIVHAMSNSCFDTTRACVAVLTPILFLPFVPPLRWLTRIALKISFWSTSRALALVTETSQSIYRVAASMARSAKHHSQRNLAVNWKSFLVRTLVGSLAAYIVSSELPLFRLVSIGTRLVRFIFRLLKAFVFLQYYVILLASLEFMLYLRVDCVMAVVGAPWFRWVVHRVWSLLTWTDIVVRI